MQSCLLKSDYLNSAYTSSLVYKPLGWFIAECCLGLVQKNGWSGCILMCSKPYSLKLLENIIHKRLAG